MATTVSWDRLRELAGFRAEKGRAVSFYLNLDPSETPTAGDAASRVNSLLDEGGKWVEANRPELTHDQRGALRGDLDRIREFYELEFERDGAHGLAVFSSSLDNFWRALPLPSPVPDGLKVNEEFFVTPLVPLLGQGEGAIVAVVGRERGEVYRLRAGRLEEVVDRSEEQPGQHDQGGWSQARYQRHIEHLVQAHLKEVGEEVERRARSLGSPIVVVASDDIRNEFIDGLSPAARTSVIGATAAEAHAGPAQLLEHVRPLLVEWQAQREADLLARWQEETGRGGRASAGWAATAEAASDGRVDMLLYQEGAEREACRCPACGRLSLAAGKCPLDGTELERREEGLDLVIHQTLSHGGIVVALAHARNLDPVEGIGALLRY